MSEDSYFQASCPFFYNFFLALRFTISGLTPSTLYQLKMEAHNVAGTCNADYTFVTLTKDGGKRYDQSNHILHLTFDSFIYFQQIHRHLNLFKKDNVLISFMRT